MKKIVKPFLRAVAVIAFIPLVVMSVALSIVFLFVFWLPSLFVSYIMFGDMYRIGTFFHQSVLDLDRLTVFDEDYSIVFNYREEVLDRIEVL